MIPRISIQRWGGASDDSRRWFEGWSLAIEWLGAIVEVNLARQQRSGIQ